MVNILLNASVTGSIVILLWCLSYPLSKKYFKASWHYSVLKIAMLFLIIPVSIFAPMLPNIFDILPTNSDLPQISAVSEQIQRVSMSAETLNAALSDIVFPAAPNVSDTPNIPDVQYSPPSFYQTSNIINNVISGEVMSDDTQNSRLNLPYLQILWLTVAVTMFSFGIRKMHKFKRQILKSNTDKVDSETLELFIQCKNQLKLRGRIALRTSEYIKTPLAFGLVRPFVILPSSNMSANEKRLAFIHELTHIKNGDLWMKFFASIIAAIHWFNPFVHLLRRKISAISEEYCDECVTKEMAEDEKIAYGNLILKVVSDISMPQFCSTLSASTKNITNIKRRLSNMLNLKKSRKGVVAISIIAILFMCFFATACSFLANPSGNNVSYGIAHNVNYSDDDENIGLTHRKFYNESFLNELREMYDHLVWVQEFIGTFEEFLDEQARAFETLEKLVAFEQENPINQVAKLRSETMTTFDTMFRETLNELMECEETMDAIRVSTINPIAELREKMIMNINTTWDEVFEFSERSYWRGTARRSAHSGILLGDGSTIFGHLQATMINGVLAEIEILGNNGRALQIDGSVTVLHRGTVIDRNGDIIRSPYTHFIPDEDGYFKFVSFTDADGNLIRGIMTLSYPPNQR